MGGKIVNLPFLTRISRDFKSRVIKHKEEQLEYRREQKTLVFMVITKKKQTNKTDKMKCYFSGGLVKSDWPNIQLLKRRSVFKKSIIFIFTSNE